MSAKYVDKSQKADTVCDVDRLIAEGMAHPKAFLRA